MKSAPALLHDSKTRWFALALLAGVAALFALIAIGSADAQANTVGVDHNGAPPDINAGPAFAGPGGSTSVSLVTDAPAGGLGSWTVNVMYDPTVVTPIGCVSYGDSSSCNLTFNSTQIRFSGLSVAGQTSMFDMADVTFQAIGTLGQCSDLIPTVVTWTDTSGGNLARPTVTNGQVCIGTQPTASPTPPPTPSPTPSPTASPTPTPSPTAVPTASPTPTPSPTAAPTASPTPTPSPTAAPTASPTATPTPSPTPSPTPTASPTATPGSELMCDGLPATIVGTNRGEWLFGTRGDDVIVALGGSDVVFGFSGNDHICLGSGHDVGYGGDGDDHIFGEAGNDLIFGERGNDFMDGGDGWDWCFGGHGYDSAMNCKGGTWWWWWRWH